MVNAEIDESDPERPAVVYKHYYKYRRGGL